MTAGFSAQIVKVCLRCCRETVNSQQHNSMRESTLRSDYICSHSSAARPGLGRLGGGVGVRS